MQRTHGLVTALGYHAAGCTYHSYIGVGKNPAIVMCSVLWRAAAAFCCTSGFLTSQEHFPCLFHLPPNTTPSLTQRGEALQFQLSFLNTVNSYIWRGERSSQSIYIHSSDTRFQVFFRTCCLYTSPPRLVFSPVAPCMAVLRILIIALSHSFVVTK